MRFEFHTYRWGDSLLGGAEIHHKRLAKELDDAGHEVSVVTTDGGDIENFCHWGVLWKSLSDTPSDKLHREKVVKLSKWQLGFLARIVQRRFESESAQVNVDELTPFFERLPVSQLGFLSHGWHYPEFHGGKAIRWMHPKGYLALLGAAQSSGIIRVTVSGYNPTDRVLVASAGTWSEKKRINKGHFNCAFEVPASATIQFVKLECASWHPVKEFRTLGVQVHSITITDAHSRTVEVDLSQDLREFGGTVPELWQNFLARKCESRPAFYGKLFDLLRGPVKLLPAKKRRAANTQRIFCNLPWATVSDIAPGDLAMPLWHIDDEFYYWKHWIAALRRAKFVLANTPYTAREFFPRLGIRAHFVGPPIWQPETLPNSEIVSAFRLRHGVAAAEILVLTVCRKSGEKRYDAIGKSVAQLAGEGVAIRMIGIGPDADGRPFEFQNCQWIGQQTGEDLQAAYAACDIFCLMSESESFGMVIPEAWHHGKPVVVNARCLPAASLVEDGSDGILTGTSELAAALKYLAENRDLRGQMGDTGRRKARANYVRGAAAHRLLDALEIESSLRA